MDFQDYQHFYQESIPFPPYVDSPTLDPSTESLVDSGLKPSLSPPHFGSPWGPPQIQRFLADNNKPTLFRNPQVDPLYQGALAGESNGVAPLLSASLHRQDSPSYTHPSSTCSSELSPPMESDYYQVHSPPTPPDTQSWSPYSSQYENWGSHGHLYQFTGLADDCVKPNEVYSYQETLPGYYEDSNIKLSLPMRGLSMSSDDSTSTVDQCNTEPVQLPRQMSPDALTPEKEGEIHIPETDAVYPQIETKDEVLSADDTEPSNLKHEDDDDDDDDDEYKPNRKRKRHNPHSSRSGKIHKRSNPLHSTPHAKRVKIEQKDPVSNITLTKPSLQGKKGEFLCKDCHGRVFKDESSLQKHIKAQHTRPFICVFHFAGCESTFASKNEWKRHCSSQHLLLSYWLCQEGQCARVSNTPQAPNKTPTSSRNLVNSPHHQATCGPILPNGTIFNRKDLYTQHLRRMHVPAHVKKQVKQKKTVPEWEERVRVHQEKSHRVRCRLPTHMDCPALGCTAHFEGANAWDERMEHVAKHLDKASHGSGSPITFGDHDITLIKWATRPEVSIIRKDEKGNWEWHNPLRPSGSPRKGMSPDGDEDAEGEEVDY